MEDVVLNEQQSEAVKLIESWYKYSDDLIFTLSGSAGTGKTFLINYLIKNVLQIPDDKIRFVAYTGKAASVISQRTKKDTSTIHRLIYNPVEVVKKVKIGDVEKEVKKIEFVKKNTIGNLKLIILDEISMVDQYILDDLISYKIKILCCGDKAQLPAIMKANTLLDSPDYNLTQIMRQKEDSIILKLAEMAKNGTPIPYGNFGDAVVLDEKSIKPETMKSILLTADQVICGLNRSRNNINTFIRQLKGIDTDRYRCPLSGEKVICVMNNYEIFLDSFRHYNLVNGTIGTISSDMDSSNTGLGVINFKPDFLNETVKNVVLDPYIFTDGVFKYEQHQRAIETYAGEFIVKESFKKQKGESHEDYLEKMRKYAMIQADASNEAIINRFEFAYAISCHKSQGSEWDHVVIFDESKAFREDSKKWLYTAITRARKKLIIIR